jgi:hypothetical protein
LIQLLAYQYRDLHDQDYKKSHDGEKFLAFLEDKLGLPKGRILSDDSKKVMKFSYPDLYYHTPTSDLKEPLVKQFDGKFQGVTLKDIYVVYVKQNAPHIGFTASVVFAMEMDDPSDDSLRKIFVPDGTSQSRFHQDFEGAWKEVAGKRETLPVVLFQSNSESSLWDAPTSSAGGLFGSRASVTLPSGRSVRMQRGFPYVSYVIHADVDSVMPKEIHQCDFAMLMALPGFVEQKLELVRGYRKQLGDVQKKLETDDFAAVQKEYNKAWRDFETVQGLAPTTTAAVQRVTQKYPGDSIFALIAKDNSQLIEFTVTAAIGATDQVRSNIQSFAQQKLQLGYNDLQQTLVKLTESTRDLQKESVKLTGSIKKASSWTALATIVLASGSGIMVWIAFYYSPSTRTQVTGTPREPIHVIAEPASPGTPGTIVALKILSELDRSHYAPPSAVILTSAKNISELIGEVPTPMATPGVSPIEIAIMQADGSVIARNSLTSEKATVAIRFAADRDLFLEGHQYYVQVSQSSVWTLKLPIRIAPN